MPPLCVQRFGKGIASRAVDMKTLIKARRLTANPQACRLLRIGAGVSLAEMAGAIGCSTAALSRWECGLRRPRGRHAIAWAAQLMELSRVA
jgi:DNA-binding transcriptional regulator YiaG